MAQIIDALSALRPDVEWSVNGTFDDPDFEIIPYSAGAIVPSRSAIEAKMAELDLAEARVRKKRVVDASVSAQASADLPWLVGETEHYLQTNLDDQSASKNREPLTVSLMGRVSLMNDTDAMPWVTRENDSIMLTKADMMMIVAAFWDRQTELIMQGRALKTQIDAMTTIEQINAFQV